MEHAIPKKLKHLMDEKLLDWLLDGDVSVQYHVHRDLLDAKPSALRRLQNRIPNEGFGKRFLDERDPVTGRWRGGYGPKWISTHYTLLDLLNIGYPGTHPAFRKPATEYVNNSWVRGGYIPKYKRWYDECVAAMLLSLACHAGLSGMEDTACDITDYLLRSVKKDGGWNCDASNYPERRVTKSSVHTTLTVLEALRDLSSFRDANGKPFPHRRAECRQAMAGGAELLLKRRVYKKIKVDQAIRPSFTQMSFPCRWFFDFLKALDWFASVNHPVDPRLTDAVMLLLKKRRKDGTWPVQAKHSGLVHFDMEKTGGPSRWNTLRALRVLKRYHSLGCGT
jgi:hypothetical protein